MFLVGNFQHQLDDKNRIRLPQKFRDKITTQEYLIMPGTGGCMFLFSADYEQKMLQALQDYESYDPEQAEKLRTITEYSATVTPDTQGRFMIPNDLLAISGIKKDVRIVGSLSKVEIWSEERYQKRRSKQDTSSEAFDSLFKDIHKSMERK